MIESRYLLKILPALLWSGLIFFLCFLPGSKIPKEDWLDKIYFDKIVHAFLYAILLVLFAQIPEKLDKLGLFISALLCLLQGVFIEFVQGSTYVQNRSFDLWDIVANIVGLIVATGIIVNKNPLNNNNM